MTDEYDSPQQPEPVDQLGTARLAGEWSFEVWELAAVLEREPTALEWVEFEVAAGRRCANCGVVLGDPGLRAVGYCCGECEHADSEADAS